MHVAHDLRRHWPSLLGFILLCYGIAAAGGLSTAESVNGWYNTLAKPAWTPPSWLFGPVWTILYGLIAWSGWLLWTSPHSEARRRALSWYFIQLMLNAIWSPVFFGMHQAGAGLAIILAMDVAVLITIVTAAKVERLAAWLLGPYLLWILYATTLNGGIFALNR